MIVSTNIYICILVYFRFSQKLKKPVSEELYTLFGYNKQENTWKEGLLCDVDENIITGLADFLVKHGMPREQAMKTAQDHFIINDHEGPGIIRPIDEPKKILELLKAYGVKTAICTADNTAGTNYMLDELDIHELFDFTLSLASHKERPAKPDPSNIHLICDRLGVDPKETVMVGDSLRDVEMGQLAGVKASVAVLSGVGCAEHLRKADYIVPSIKHVLDLVLPQGYEKKSHESKN